MEVSYMPSPYIVDPSEEVKREFIAPNIVTVARSLDKQLNKTIFGDGRSDIPYKNAFKYRFFSIEVEHLNDLCQLVRYLIHRPQSCLIRGVAIDDSIPIQRRLQYPDKTKGDAATVIDQELNWYALDVDSYGISSGNLKEDAKTVLLALGLENVQAFAIPSANYLIKDGIRIRLFLWNSMKISCRSLRAYFTKIVDPSIFGPIQPIYVARPTFVGRNDPCKDLVAWIPGDTICTEIQNIPKDGGYEYKYTKKQARAYLQNPRPYHKDVDDRILWEFGEGERHRALFRVALFMGKLIEQDLLDEDEVIERLTDQCLYYWRGSAKRDLKTIQDGIKFGKQNKGESDYDF